MRVAPVLCLVCLGQGAFAQPVPEPRRETPPAGPLPGVFISAVLQAPVRSDRPHRRGGDGRRGHPAADPRQRRHRPRIRARVADPQGADEAVLRLGRVHPLAQRSASIAQAKRGVSSTSIRRTILLSSPRTSWAVGGSWEAGSGSSAATRTRRWSAPATWRTSTPTCPSTARPIPSGCRRSTNSTCASTRPGRSTA